MYLGDITRTAEDCDIANLHARRIAICLPDLRGGGAERSTVQIANGLAARGFRVDLVLLRLEGDYLHEISPAVHVVNLNAARARCAILPLARYFKTEKPTVVFSVLLNIPVLISFLLSGRAAKVVLSERSHFSQAGKSAKSFNARFSVYLAKYLYRFADRIVSVSKSGATDLVESGVLPYEYEKVCTIYNPVINEQVFQMQQECPDHEWFNDAKRPVILAVGRLVPVKDYPTLLRAFALIEDRSTRLIILGEGGERTSLEALANSLGIAERVSMPGFRDNPYAYMARANVFVICSRYEGLPGALIQALACGATPAATDSPGGIAEILGDSLCDYLVPPGNPEALSKAMAMALVHPLPSEQLRERAMVFSEQASIDAYEKLIDELLSQA